MTPEGPLNAFRHCPCCASATGAWATLKQFTCADCGFEYFQNAAAAVMAIIRDAEGRVLMTRRAREPRKGALELPGGFVDPLETAEEAVRREVREEVGLEVTDCRYLLSSTNRYDYANVTYYSLDLAFLCEVSNLSTLTAPDEVSEVVFLYPAEATREQVAFGSVWDAFQALER